MKERPDTGRLMKAASDKLLKRAGTFPDKNSKKYPDFRAGDTIRVFVKVKEGEKARVQAFEGVVIKMRRGGERSSFTVRKVSSGIGVERIFPFYSPVIDRITLISKGEVRRAKLFYLRGLKGRKGRIKGDYVYEDTVSATTTDSSEGSASKEGAEDVSKKAAQA